MPAIKSLGVASVAKTCGIIGAIFGVLTIPISLMTAGPSSGSDIAWRVYLSPLHLLIVVGTATVLGVFHGTIGALAYNFVARWTGGIEIEP